MFQSGKKKNYLSLLTFNNSGVENYVNIEMANFEGFKLYNSSLVLENISFIGNSQTSLIIGENNSYALLKVVFYKKKFENI